MKAIRLHWYDRDKAYSEIGRCWAGTYFEPNYQRTNVISWDMRRVNHRSRRSITIAGCTLFDKRDSINEYSITPYPLNQYYDSATKSGYELNSTVVSVVAGEVASAAIYLEPVPEESGGLSAGVAAGLGILALALVAVAVYMLKRKKPGSPSPSGDDEVGIGDEDTPPPPSA